jgi:hypothetical protein
LVEHLTFNQVVEGSIPSRLISFSLIKIGSPHRLAWPRTPAFHAGDAGSNPAGDANFPRFSSCPRVFYGHHLYYLKMNGINIFHDSTDLDRAVAEKFRQNALKAQSEGRNFSVALWGGKTPNGVYARLAKPEFRASVLQLF